MTGEDVIERIRSHRKLYELRIKQKAFEVYASFNANEKTVTRFGMMPREKMEKAQAELIHEFHQADDEKQDTADIARLLAVGVMDAANAGPQKMVV